MSKEIWTSVIQILKILTPSVIESHILIRKNKEIALVQEESVELAQAVGAENFLIPGNDINDQNVDDKDKVIPSLSEEKTAQIIPLRPENVPIPVASEVVIEDVDQFKLDTTSESETDNILGLHKERAQEERAKLIEKQKQESTSVFILNQRIKLRESKKKLIGQSAMTQYKREINSEHLQVRQITEEDENFDDKGINISSSAGILVNKKQA